MNTEPVIPSEDTGDPNDRFLCKVLKPGANELAPDAQTYIHRISGVYYYGLKKTPKQTDKLTTAALPNLQATVADNELPSGNKFYVQTILDPDAPPNQNA